MPSSNENQWKYAFWGLCIMLLFVTLLFAAALNSQNKIISAEILEIRQYDLPRDFAIVGIKAKNTETNEELSAIFHVSRDNKESIKKGRRYLLVYNLDVNEDLKKFGVDYSLSKVYELK